MPNILVWWRARRGLCSIAIGLRFPTYCPFDIQVGQLPLQWELNIKKTSYSLLYSERWRAYHGISTSFSSPMWGFILVRLILWPPPRTCPRLRARSARPPKALERNMFVKFVLKSSAQFRLNLWTWFSRQIHVQNHWNFRWQCRIKSTIVLYHQKLGIAKPIFVGNSAYT